MDLQGRVPGKEDCERCIAHSKGALHRRLESGYNILCKNEYNRCKKLTV